MQNKRLTVPKGAISRVSVEFESFSESREEV